MWTILLGKYSNSISVVGVVAKSGHGEIVEKGWALGPGYIVYTAVYKKNYSNAE